jgi:tetratricopeptide (TPR) repeat protein
VGTASKELKGYIKTESMMLIVLVALVIGFLGGVAFSAWETSGKMGGAPASGDEVPSLTTDQKKKLLDLTQKNSKDINSWTELGHLYFDTGQPGPAIDAYKEVLRLNPELPDIWTDIGVMYRRNGNPGQAVASFDRALSIDPDHEAALFNKGVVLMHDLSRPEEALAVWARLVQLNPTAESPGGQQVQDLVNQLKKSQP